MLLVSLAGGGEGGYSWTQILELSLRFHPWDSSTPLLVQLFPTAFVGGSQAVAEHLDCHVQGYQMLNDEERVGFATTEESWVCMNQVVLFTQAHHESGFSTTQQQNWSMSCCCWKSCSSRFSWHCYKRLGRERTWNSQMRWRYCCSSLRLIIIQCQKWWWWWWEGSWRMESHRHKDQPPPSIVM